LTLTLLFKATINKLVAIGCDIGQGYYWSKPVTQDALSEMLRNQQQH
jgi:EAL domain-containing protein (putative c-di-GMP-specific phosphodiesterase class I)